MKGSLFVVVRPSFVTTFILAAFYLSLFYSFSSLSSINILYHPEPQRNQSNKQLASKSDTTTSKKQEQARKQATYELAKQAPTKNRFGIDTTYQ